jgi:VanZ family protein
VNDTAPRHRSLAVPLSWLYAGLIAYASLYPFAGWREPMVPPWQFLLLPWPRWWTAFDLWSNLLGYMPLGALVFVAAVRQGRGARTAWLAASLSGLGLSLCLEALQNFLPQRVPSNVDLGLNLAGAALGAGLAALAHARGGVQRWQTLRERWFSRRSAGGLALLVLWPIALLFPLPLPLALGQAIPRIREAAGQLLDDTPAQAWIQAWWLVAGEAGLSRAGETTAVTLGLLGPCLVAYSISPAGWRRVVLGVGALCLGTATTTLSTALNFAPQHALAWATPVAAQGLLIGAALALLLFWLPRRAAAAFGLLALLGLLLLVARAPSDPYFASSLQAWEQGRFIRFHGAAQWVGWLWPYAAMLQLAGVLLEGLHRPGRGASGSLGQ